MDFQRMPRVPRYTLLPPFLLIFLVIVTLSAVASGLFTYQRFQVEQEALQHAEDIRLGLADKVVYRNLEQSIIDLRLLSESEILQDYLQAPTPRNTTRLQKDFINLSRLTGLYDQIRYIDHDGKERIRINYNNGEPQAVATEQLQDKANRYYFRESIRLPTGHIYLSPLDLNVENGKIELPLKPMIRIATPLFDPATKQTAGILILNYLAAHTLSRFQEVMAESRGSAMILNRDGYWLFSHRHEDEWGFMYGNNKTFAARYPQAWAAMSKTESGNIKTPEGLFSFITLRPNAIAGLASEDTKTDALVWRLLSRVSPDKLNFSLWQGMHKHAGLTLWIVVMIALLSYLLAWLRMNNIDKTTALKVSKARYLNLFENMVEGYALLDAIFDAEGRACDFRYLEINPAFERILGLRREQVIDNTLLTLLPKTESYWLETFARVATTGEAARLEQYGGSFGRYFEITAACPEHGLVAIFFEDVTERKHAQEQQRQASTAFNNTMEAIMITDADAEIIVVNQAYTKITGYESSEVIGKTPRIHKSGRHDEAFYSTLWQALARNGQWQGEIWNQRKDGQVYPAWENISAVKDNHGHITNYVSVFSDISTIKQTEARLSQLAHHDALTGLANRLSFNLNLEQALERARRHQHKIGLLFLDLDHFKLINDTLGHEAGDKLLQIISERLKQNVRAEDIVARLGGDEFTIILEEIGHNEDAATLAQKLIHAVAEPMQLNDQEIVISTSIGLSIFPDDATTATDLAKAADTAMYRAKARGRHTFEFYSSEMSDYTMHRLSIENNLRHALMRDELLLYYQPQYDITTGNLCGVEALLRWQHPELGLLLPAQFIHIAEESHLIDEIGKWVLHQVCIQVRRWRDAGLPQIRIAINLSVRQIMYDSTVEILQHALAENNLKPAEVLLELEITESVLKSETQIVEPLQQLRLLGASIAIDDFGTGYSSLSQLKQLPIDTLKIDRAFLRNIPMDSNNKAITSAIISMGHSLGMRVIAEGIETPAQLQFLKQRACDEGQGFLFCKALPAEQFEKYLSNGELSITPTDFAES
jgi:diguanylate cyclase (GGDEF)-like protein/PAS domain S-box-containing protein